MRAIAAISAEEGRLLLDLAFARHLFRGLPRSGQCNVRQRSALLPRHGDDLACELAEFLAQQPILVAADASVGQLLLELGQLGAQPRFSLASVASDLDERRDDAASPSRLRATGRCRRVAY